MNTLFLTLFRPARAFNQLKAETFSAMSLMIVLLFMIINLILSIPVSEKIFQITTASMSLNPNQSSMISEITYKMRYLQVAGVAIMYLVMFLFYALLLQLAIRISKSRIDYKKALQLLVCCYLVVAIGDLVNTALIYIRGVDMIGHVYDLSLTGLNLLTSIEQVGATGYVFLSSINPFQLWFVVLLCIGLKVLAEMKPVKAIVICILFWLITILFPVLSVYFSQATLEKVGVM